MHPDCAFLAFTNGTLIDEEFCQDMLEVKNFVPAISLEGFEIANDSRRGDGCFESVKKAMALLKEHHLPFGISTCYTSVNYKDIASDAFFDLMIDSGALFCLSFHYMPVGNAAVTDLLPTPEQRAYVYHQIRKFRSEKPIFTMDFQNDAQYVGGCIAGGRRYLHINAKGDVEPCVFIHYSNVNIHDTSLLDALRSPLFQSYHDHQPFNDNMLMPCPMLENACKILAMVKQAKAVTRTINPKKMWIIYWRRLFLMPRIGSQWQKNFGKKKRRIKAILPFFFFRDKIVVIEGGICMRRNVRFSGLSKLPNGNTSNKIVDGCIVLEGGAFRGIYTNGVLDALMQFEINMRCTIGTSAGALNGLNYVAGQIGRSARINLGYRHDSRYVGLEAVKKNNGIIGFDFLLKGTQYFDPLNIRRFMNPNRDFIAVCTNCLTGKPEYFSKNKTEDIFKAVQASASMPYVSKMVQIEDGLYLDGGCSDKIAYQWAIDHGFKKIIVVRTRQRDFRKSETNLLVKRMTHHIYGQIAAFERKLETMNEDYNRQCDELIELEKQGRIFTIAPSLPVHVGRVESDMEKLGDLYYMGYLDGLNQIQKIKDYLEIV